MDMTFVEFPRPASPPELADEAVRLRPWRPEDAARIVDLCDDVTMAQWLDQLPQPYTFDNAQNLIAFGSAAWQTEGDETPLAITDVSTDEPVGGAVLFWDRSDRGVVELGYWVGSEARGRGVASRSVELLTRWLLDDLGYARVELRADPNNVASCRVAEKAGFRFEGVARSIKWHARTGQRLDLAVYSRLPGDVPSS